MRAAILATVLFTLAPATAAASAAGGESFDLMSPDTGLMAWTLVIFFALFFVLKKWAFKPITAAVEAREKALEEAIEGAKRDRLEAARILAEIQAQIVAARGEAQKLIADGRATADKVRADLLEQTRQQQTALLERARHDIENEKVRAIADLRREAVDLAIAGASKVIEKNLDDAANRKLVETFLASIPATPVSTDRAR